MKIKEITKDMIGREVELSASGDWFTVCAIEGNEVWLKDCNGEHGTWGTKNDWELKDLPEPQEKPSQTIACKVFDAHPSGVITAQDYVNAILFFLDEHAEVFK